jgi:hypothetical protein
MPVAGRTYRIVCGSCLLVAHFAPHKKRGKKTRTTEGKKEISEDLDVLEIAEDLDGKIWKIAEDLDGSLRISKTRKAVAEDLDGSR